MHDSCSQSYVSTFVASVCIFGAEVTAWSLRRGKSDRVYLAAFTNALNMKYNKPWFNYYLDAI